jgi:hypothetical protein
MPKRRAVTAIVPTRQIPLAELVEAGKWRIWLAYTPERTSGTYLTLHYNGRITSESLLESGQVVHKELITPVGGRKEHDV